MAERAQLKVRQRIRRMKDGREFVVSFVNPKARLFSATSADGKWSDWGGPVPLAEEIEVLHG